VDTDIAVSTVSVTAWLQEASAAIAAEADHLTQLDSAIGDGDHGVNLTRGFRAATEAMAADDDGLPPGRQLILAGKTLVSTVGGASGPLWGMALRRAGRSLGDAAAVDGPGLAGALDAALAGVVELGAAEPGDKTMVDALLPALEALEQASDLDSALRDAASAAERGMRDTIPLVARKGRASYLGERSKDHQDPGATSTYYLCQTAAEALSG
jgi:dihydroxyacetone kinase-like protein